MNEGEIKPGKKSIIKKMVANFYSWLNKSLKSFLVIALVGLQIALLLSYIYFIYRDKIGAVEGIRDTLSYQGKITNSDGVPPPDGQYNLRFRIYNQSTNGTLLWTEIWNGTDQGQAGSKVEIAEGVFNVELNSLCGNWVGSCASGGGVTFKDDSFYLQVEMDYDSNGSFEEIFAPRKRFTATPYAMNADKLDGRDYSEFILKEGGTMTGTLSAPKFTDSSLLAYYQFNNDADDSSPNSLNGTLSGSPIVSQDVLELNGTDQYALVSDNNLLSFGNGTVDLPFSISAWVNMTEATNFKIAGKGVYNTDAEYQFFIDSSDKVQFQIYDNSVASTYLGRSYDTALTDYEGKWLNLVATYDGSAASSGIKIYLNGIRVDDTSSENNAVSYTAMENLAGDLLIGKNSTYFANGKFDEVKFFKRDLTADEIKRIYESQARNQIQANEITAGKISFEASVAGEKESGYLSWDKAHNRLKFNTEVYAPNIMPYFNSDQDRDYSYINDANKILAYDFHDSVGLTVTDLAGNANGTINGNADWTNLGYIGYGMKFGADGDSVSFADPGLSSTQGSVEFWVKFNNITTSANNYIIRMSENTSNEIVMAKENQSDIYFKVGDSGKIPLGNLPDTNWHHIAITWNSGNIDFYGDGQPALNTTYTNLDTSRFDKFYLGSAGSADTSLDGSLDGVAIYDDVLTPAEIKNHYNSAFNNLYLANNLSDGSISASVSSIAGISASNNEYDRSDPVYFTNDSKVVGLAFSEGQGTTTANVTEADTPTITGTKWKKGFYGFGLEFNGISDFLTLADSTNLNMGTDNFSLEFYLKADASDQTNKRIISKRSGDTGYEVYFDSNNKINFFIGDGTNTFVSNVAGGSALNDGKWHNVMITFNRSGNALIVYDSAPIYIQNITSVTGSLDNTADLYISKDSTANFYKGILDSVLIYNGLELNLGDIVARRGSGPEILVINSRGGTSGLASLLVLNNSSSGDGSIIGLLSSNNTTAYPLKIWNESSVVSGSDTIYNLIHFGTNSQNFGNLIWDSTNTQFVFDQSIKTTGDLTSNYLKTNDNEFLAFDAIRHTLTSDDVTNSYFTEAWGKATKDKIVSLHGIVNIAGGSVTGDQDWWSYNTENRIEYDGTDMRAEKLGGTWVEGDVVTIFVVYEK